MQNKKDSTNDDNLWAISFRKLDIWNDTENKSIERGHSSTAYGMQSDQNGDLSTLAVQQLQDGKSLEHNQKGARPKTGELHRRWLVCLSAFVVSVIDVGFLNAFGTLFVDIMEEFQTTRANAAVIQSVFLGVCLGTGVLSGVLVTKFGPRRVGLVGGILVPTGLILSYFANGMLMLDLAVGVISGLGMSFLYISNNAAIGLNFNGPCKVLALSLASTGTGVGGLSYPFLLRYLREKFGLQETFLIVGGLTLNTIPCAMLWAAPEEKDIEADETRIRTELYQESSEQNQHKSLQLITALFRSSSYMLFVLGNMCVSAPGTTFTIFITDIYSQKGFGKSDSTFGISLMNIFSLFGKLAPGILKQIPKYSALYTPILCCVISAILMTSVNVTISLAAILSVNAGLGFSFGVLTSTFTVTTASLLEPQLFSSAVGLVLTMNGVINLAIGPLSGLVKDVTQSYEYVLYGSTVLMTCGCASFCAAFWIRRRNRRQAIDDHHKQ